MTLSCIAVDDEPLALEKILDYIDQVPFLDCQASFDNGLKAYHFLQEHTVDVIFLDIQMPELTGIQLLKVLKNRPNIILTTAYSDYALEGYELDVTDYLLKPISFERFLVAVQKLKRPAAQPAMAEAKEEDHPGYIFVKTEYRIEKVDIGDILWVEGMKDYLRIHTSHGPLMTLMSFSKILEMLPNNMFLRIHRSFIVPIDKITKIERNEVHLGEQILPIGASFREAFYSFLKDRNLL